jgi:hypothetical protein
MSRIFTKHKDLQNESEKERMQETRERECEGVK